MSMKRRDFIAASLAAGASLAAPMVRAQAPHRVVILGGGIGGATAAKFIKIVSPEVDVTVIDRDRKYYTCPRSNDVITGFLPLETITFDLSSHERTYGIKTVYDEIVGVDFDAQVVATGDGSRVPYDRLIVSPGIELQIDDVFGYSEEAANTVMPHGWKAGSQTMLLREQFLNLPQGATVVIAAPPNPFRCPPGPYERASMMADVFRHHNPTAKIIILDAKDKFTKQGPFTKGWERLYGYGTDNSMIEWVPASEGGAVAAVDPETMTVETAAGKFKGDLVNIIPPMKAGALAQKIGLANSSGWCPINQQSFASDLAPNVHVIGDSCIAGAMPKSGYAANSQAKMLSQVVRAQLAGDELPVGTFANACYSLVSEEYGVSIAAIYKINEEGVIVGASGGISKIDDLPNRPVLEAVYQKNWHRTFAADVFS